MSYIRLSAFFLLVLLTSLCFSQIDRISIAAGSPEDKELTAIGNESDLQKKISSYEEFLQKYASNPPAVAYGTWQLSQAYQANGDMQKAMDIGDKALALSPRNLDILSSQVVIAQQLRNYPGAFKYALLGGTYYNSIEKQSKPAGIADDAFQTNVKFDLDSNKNNYQFFQSAAFAVIQNENDAKARMNEIERFTAAFPKSGLDEQLTSYALASLSEINDTPRLIAYANKVLETSPDNFDALLMLSNTYLDNGNATKAITYAQRLIVAAKADDPGASKSNRTFAGMGHTAMGRAYASQQKMQPSIAELKSAVDLLKGQDEQQYAIAAYFLGWDYARENRFADARAILSDVVAIPGPVQAPAKDLLGKVNSARAAGN